MALHHTSWSPYAHDGSEKNYSQVWITLYSTCTLRTIQMIAHIKPLTLTFKLLTCITTPMSGLSIITFMW